MAPNRRKYPRIKLVRMTIKAKLKGTDTFSEVELINLSAGGLCFMRNFIVNHGDVIIMRFTFKTRHIDLIGRIVRIEGREVGVQFASSEDEVKDLVDSFNAELSSYLIPSSGEGSRLVLPGYTTPARDKDKEIDAMLDIDTM